MTAPARLALVPGLDKTSAAFRAGLVGVARRVGADPSHLAAVMSFETIETFSPSIPNGAGSGAVGLLQFLPSTARRLGTSCAQLARMSATEQLAYVEAYLRPFKGRISSLENLSLAVFAGLTGKAAGDVLYRRGVDGDKYNLNRNLDTNGDGTITVAEYTAGPRAKLSQARGFVDVVEGPTADAASPLSSSGSAGSPGACTAAAAAPREYVVACGDSLSSIAKAITGKSLRWRELYLANAKTIANPNHIEPGDRLTLPADWPTIHERR